MLTLFFRHFITVALWLFISKAGLGQSEITNTLDNANFDASQVVDNTVLDSMRGGFVTGEGVRLDIGVQKASYVDGVLQVQNSFRAEDVAFINKGYGGTVFANDLQDVSSAFNTLIQNNVDQKTIQNFTVLDVNVRNFSNLQSGFVEAIRGLQDVHTIK